MDFYIKLYAFTTAGAAAGGDARYVLSGVYHMGDIDIWPVYPFWIWPASAVGPHPTLGTHLEETLNINTTDTITYYGGIAVSKT